MPFGTPTLLTFLADSVDRPEYSTPAISFPGLSLAVVILTYSNAAIPALDVVVSGGGLGIFLLAQEGSISSSSRRQMIFTLPNLLPTPSASEVITVGSALGSTFTSMLIDVIQIPDVVLASAFATTFEKAVGAAVTTLVVPLPAFGPANVLTLAMFCTVANAAIAAGAGFTNLDDRGTATPTSRQSVQWAPGADQTPDATFASTIVGGIAVGINLNPAPAVASGGGSEYRAGQRYTRRARW